MKNILGLTALAGAFALGAPLAFAQDATPEVAAEETVTEAPAEAEAAAAAEEPAVEVAEGIREMVIGDPNAPVTFIEYGSFTCPHCATFHNNQFQQLKAEYIDNGQVQFIFREVYFDRFGLWASMIARCGDNSSRFFPIHDVLYEDQAAWIAGGQDPALIASNLRTIGINAGLTAEEVDACMADEGAARALVEWYDANAQADDIQATPTLIIDGTKYSNMSFADMQPIIEAALAD